MLVRLLFLASRQSPNQIIAVFDRVFIRFRPLQRASTTTITNKHTSASPSTGHKLAAANFKGSHRFELRHSFTTCVFVFGAHSSHCCVIFFFFPQSYLHHYRLEFGSAAHQRLCHTLKLARHFPFALANKLPVERICAAPSEHQPTTATGIRASVPHASEKRPLDSFRLPLRRRPRRRCCYYLGCLCQQLFSSHTQAQT